MADDIKQVNPAKLEVDGEDVEIAAGAVQSVTTSVPHEADASSAPGPYQDLDVERPPVSTARPDVPIAHSLVAGAGAPQPPPEGDYREMLDADPPKNLYVQPGDNVEGVKRGPGRPKKSESE